MKKFLKKHSGKIALAAFAYGLYLTCDWQWTNFKSFLSGALFSILLLKEVKNNA